MILDLIKGKRSIHPKALDSLRLSAFMGKLRDLPSIVIWTFDNPNHHAAGAIYIHGNFLRQIKKLPYESSKI